MKKIIASLLLGTAFLVVNAVAADAPATKSTTKPATATAAATAPATK